MTYDIEILLPNILIEDHCKYLEECIRLLHNANNQKDLSFHDNESSKMNQLLILKNRMGYIYPLYESFSISDDNDYSDSFLVKKYVVKMDILLRTDDNKTLNIFEFYNEYEEEAKEITWVFPHIIYPKDNNQQPKDYEIEELIERSPKKCYNLQYFTYFFTIL